MTTKHISRWTILAPHHKNKHNKLMSICVCSCGTFRVVSESSIRSKISKSCGCIRKTPKNKTHGMTKTNIYSTWQGMKDRCYNRANKKFCDYGGRGVAVCSEWVDSFKRFYADMGDKPTLLHSIDRIDNDGNYEPSNCRWATQITQTRNRRMKSLNTSGITGVSWCKRDRRWLSTISIDKKIKSLGRYGNIFDAAAARISYENSINFYG